MAEFQPPALADRTSITPSLHRILLNPACAVDTQTEVMNQHRHILPTIAVISLVVLGTWAPSAGAQDGRDASGRIVGPSDALGGVAVTSPSYDPVHTALQSALAGVRAAQAAVDLTTSQVADLAAKRSGLVAAMASEDAQIAALRAQRTEDSGAVVTVSVRRYVDGPSFDWIDPTRELSDIQDRHASQTVLADASKRLTDRLRAVDIEISAADGRQRDRSDQLADIDRQAASASRQLADVTATLTVRTAAVESARSQEFSARTGASVVGTDLSLVALDAYWRAANAANADTPACHLPWFALAAIGFTESHHGGDLGPDGLRRVGSDGTPPARILGPVLDGTGGNKRILDTDHGVLDGDPVLERAVGPMQFLPGTWRTNGRDGSGDGVADVDNFYDATRSAAAYLCKRGIPLDTDAGMAAGFKSYGGTAAYAARALPIAHGYASAVPLPATG